MIFEEYNKIEGFTFNRRLEASDWRYSATALGIKRFLNFHSLPYRSRKRNFYYNIEDISNEKDDRNYLAFVESYFHEYMHHIKILELLKFESNEENIKEINDKLSANTIMKRIFKEIKYDGKNKDEIKILISKNKDDIIRDTYINGKKMYAKYCNTSKYRTQKGEVCRLLGFYVDTGRKLRSLGFGFNKNARIYNDELEFDFIPFAFTKGIEAIFINNNISMENIFITNDRFVNKIQNINEWKNSFFNYVKGSQYIDYDVEIIKKVMELEGYKNNYYESFYLRSPTINIFKELSERRDKQYIVKILKLPIKINESEIRLINEVINCIINLRNLDELINSFFKLKIDNQASILAILININTVIYKNLDRLEGNMDNDKYLKTTRDTAFDVLNKLKEMGNENKIKTYRHKLISAIVTNDYDHFIEIMLQLSSYTEIAFIFMHELIADFETNKNLAYAFINSLIENKEKSDEKDKNKNEKENEK